jgi:BirA family biotin operon repressor/biotin-[acetyl-CoA-carboxylase] ligase
VAASLALEAPWPIDKIGPLPLVAGLAMRAALGSLGADVRLKWPNDLMDPDGAKVGGLLSEMSDGVLVIGVGVNLFFPDAPAGITGLYDADPGAEFVASLVASWADQLLDAIEAGPAWDRDEYRKASMLLGESITWVGGSGTAVDIAEDGALVVLVGNERVELRSGAVRLIRRATLAADDGRSAVGEGQ